MNEKENEDIDENDIELGGQSDTEADHEKSARDKDREDAPEPLENHRWLQKD